MLNMDETQAETTEVTYDIADTNLPAIMASLEMLTVNTSSSSNHGTVFRKNVAATDSNESLNRRCSLRPRKRTCTQMDYNNRKEKGTKEYYLHGSLKRKLNTLETIFEEKDDANESTLYMGVKRYRRMIEFKQKPSDSKIKKRRARIKKVFGSKSNFKRKQASMQMLLDKLNDIRAESPAKINNEVK